MTGERKPRRQAPQMWSKPAWGHDHLWAHPCVYTGTLFPPNRHFASFTTFHLYEETHLCTADRPNLAPGPGDVTLGLSTVPALANHRLWWGSEPCSKPLQAKAHWDQQARRPHCCVGRRAGHSVRSLVSLQAGEASKRILLESLQGPALLPLDFSPMGPTCRTVKKCMGAVSNH